VLLLGHPLRALLWLLGRGWRRVACVGLAVRGHLCTDPHRLLAHHERAALRDPVALAATSPRVQPCREPPG